MGRQLGQAVVRAPGRLVGQKRPKPGPPKECFLEVFSYLRATKAHSFGGLGGL